jgi:hypothetical protein
MDPHEALRLLERQRTQQDRVHDAEDRGVRTYPERQHADNGRDERRFPGHRSERITKISKQGTH